MVLPFAYLPPQLGAGLPRTQIAGALEGRQLSFTPSVARLTRGVDLLIGYVDLRYGCPFEELADLSQRADRRKVAPISLVQPLLMVAALSDGHTLGHAARIEALEELNLEPGGHNPLGKKPL